MNQTFILTQDPGIADYQRRKGQLPYLMSPVIKMYTI